jgi:hypothetical protein
MKISNFLAPCMLSFALVSSIQYRNDDCLTKMEAVDIVARGNSIAIKINSTVVDETVTHDFKFYSDSQDFLEGLLVSSIPEVIFLSKC